MKALCISMLCFKINIKFFFTLSIDSMRITDIDCTSDNVFLSGIIMLNRYVF